MNKDQEQTLRHIKYMATLGSRDTTLEKAIKLIEELAKELEKSKSDSEENIN